MIIDHLPLIGALVIFIAIPITSYLTTYAIKSVDQDSIVSLRRIFALSVASNLIWTVPLAVGSLVSWIQGSIQSSINEFLVGAFLACSLQLLVINGAFVSSTPKSLGIAILQPAAIILPASAFVLNINISTIYATMLGVLLVVITTVFLLKFKSFKTEAVGINSLQVLQSFLKSWVSQKPANLESYFTMYSRNEPVTTRAIIVASEHQARTAVVLPGVHPGPFYPVGSYNISELIFHKLREIGITPMVLHGVGGHERNLPTNELAKEYASQISSTIGSPSTSQQIHGMKGPSRARIGTAEITSLAFGNQVITFLSNAPYNTDDLEPSIIDEAVSAATDLGIQLMLVDAHNSIGGENCPLPHIDWRSILSEITVKPEEQFQMGVAHSSELEFHHGLDVSEGGITALAIRKQESTYALITSDSNNAVLGLRQIIIDDLDKEHINLIELCTSDTHGSAARYLTRRGYHALGEDTTTEILESTVRKLAKLAESRLSQGTATTITSQTTLPLIGDKSLNDFAALTKEVLTFTKAYATAAVLSILVICSVALI